MKRGLTIGMAIAAIGLTFNYVMAGSLTHSHANRADVLPSDVLSNVREIGLTPSTEPLRRGPYYILHAVDPRGVEVRVVADAALGDVLSVTPSKPYEIVPQYTRGPRIIHVPQPGDDRASVDDRDEAAAPADADDDQIAPPRPRAKRPVQHRSDKPPVQHRSDKPRTVPPKPTRTVLSAPPPPVAAPVPIRPTPNFDAKTEGDKFAPPNDSAAAAPEPPTPAAEQ